MRGCLFTLLLGAIVVAFAVIVGLPILAGGILTAGLSAAGLAADDTTVTVSSNPPTDLLAMRADTVRITATDATFRGMAIGSLDLALGDVRILDRTAGAIDGELRDVRVTVAGGQVLTLNRITVLGAGRDIATTTVVPNEAAEDLIADAIEEQVGIRPESVSLDRPDLLTIRAGVAVTGRLDVTASGDLVIRADDGPLAGSQVVLLRGGDDLPIELTSVRVNDNGGLRLEGDLSIGLLGALREARSGTG